MIEQAFCIFDSKVGEYNRPFFARTIGDALRMFQDSVDDPKSMLHKHAADFTLFHLGEYHGDSGQFHNLESPRSCGVALEFKKQYEIPAEKLLNLKPIQNEGPQCAQ